MEVWTSIGFILQTGLEISFLHLLSVEVLGPYAQKNRNWGKKKRGLGSNPVLWSDWMPKFLLTSAGPGFLPLSCQLKLSSIDKQDEGWHLPFCSVSVFSFLPTFHEVFGTAYWQKQLWPKKKKKSPEVWSFLTIFVFPNYLWILMFKMFLFSRQFWEPSPLSKLDSLFLSKFGTG